MRVADQQQRIAVPACCLQPLASVRSRFEVPHARLPACAWSEFESALQHPSVQADSQQPQPACVDRNEGCSRWAREGEVREGAALPPPVLLQSNAGRCSGDARSTPPVCLPLRSAPPTRSTWGRSAASRAACAALTATCCVSGGASASCRSTDEHSHWHACGARAPVAAAAQTELSFAVSFHCCVITTQSSLGGRAAPACAGRGLAVQVVSASLRLPAVLIRFYRPYSACVHVKWRPHASGRDFASGFHSLAAPEAAGLPHLVRITGTGGPIDTSATDRVAVGGHCRAAALRSLAAHLLICSEAAHGSQLLGVPPSVSLRLERPARACSRCGLDTASHSRCCALWLPVSPLLPRGPAHLALPCPAPCPAARLW